MNLNDERNLYWSNVITDMILKEYEKTQDMEKAIKTIKNKINSENRKCLKTRKINNE